MKDNDLKSDLDKIIRDIYHLHIVQRHEMTRLLDKTDDPIVIECYSNFIDGLTSGIDRYEKENNL